MSKMVDEYYNTIAASYDRLHGEEQDKKLKDLLLHVELRQNITLLDVGCGTGRSKRLLDLYDIQWHGVEPSEGLIHQAPQDAQHRIKRAAAEHIPFPDASFDVILSLTAIQNFDDVQKSFKEMKRVTKKGGLFLLSFLKKSPRTKDLEQQIRAIFTVKESWEQEKDILFVCE